MAISKMAENHGTIEGIINSPVTAWGPDDAYSFYRFLTHALYKAPKYEFYSRAIRSLNLNNCSTEARCIARAAIADIPGSIELFSPESQAALSKPERPERPIALTSSATRDSRLSEFGVLL